MAGGWDTKRVLITVRTYPVPASRTVEASCTGGVTKDGNWIRLYPVPYRFLDEDKRFSKWHWIDVEVTKPTSDPRPESFKLKPDKIQIVGEIGTHDGWRARRELLKPLTRPSMCQIRRERDERGYPTLGFFKPAEIKRLTIEPVAADWTAAELAILRQDTLFEKAPADTLEKIPFNFKYEFRCSDPTCKGHEMSCTDWEMGQAYRRWRRQYRDGWEQKFRERFEAEMMQKNDTSFFVGTVHKHPHIWIIVGLFYPPKATMNDLFDGSLAG
jgi:hypothetical protein